MLYIERTPDECRERARVCHEKFAASDGFQWLLLSKEWLRLASEQEYATLFPKILPEDASSRLGSSVDQPFTPVR